MSQISLPASIGHSAADVLVEGVRGVARRAGIAVLVVVRRRDAVADGVVREVLREASHGDAAQGTPSGH